MTGLFCCVSPLSIQHRKKIIPPENSHWHQIISIVETGKFLFHTNIFRFGPCSFLEVFWSWGVPNFFKPFGAAREPINVFFFPLSSLGIHTVKIISRVQLVVRNLLSSDGSFARGATFKDGLAGDYLFVSCMPPCCHDLRSIHKTVQAIYSDLSRRLVNSQFW